MNFLYGEDYYSFWDSLSGYLVHSMYGYSGIQETPYEDEEYTLYLYDYLIHHGINSTSILVADAIYISDTIGDFCRMYGTPRHSGRYPWGSGKNPQRNKHIYTSYNELKAKGYTEKQIADNWNMSTTELRKCVSLGSNEIREQNRLTAKELKEKGYSIAAISRRMEAPESTVRSWLDESIALRKSKTADNAQILKDFVDEHDYVDIGPGTEQWLNQTRTSFKNSVKMLEDQGYQIQYYPVDQMGTNHKTTITVLAKPGSPYRSGEEKFDISSIAARVVDESGSVSKLGLEKPVSVDPSRIKVNYTTGDKGGIERDGLIFIRPGNPDLSLGTARYAQVRIAVNDTHYIKGMALYDPNLPKGVDILVNSNKKPGTPLVSDDPDAKTVLKPMKRNEKTGDIDWDNPFGASIKDPKNLVHVQREYTDIDGKKKLSSINVVNEEGDWSTWSKTLPAQFLSKQTLPLAKRQLALEKADREAEFDIIKNMTNPTIKRKLLYDFADNCDAAAVDLAAAPLPRQAWHVLMPFPDIKQGEVYAPRYRDGETVALVRFPHEGTYQIPICKVRNKGTTADKFLHNAPDAIGINQKTASQLSGADFDGDTVIVIPITDKSRIRAKDPIPELVKFDTEEAYPKYPGMKVISHAEQQLKMGVVSNLITDMTLAGADTSELVRATKYAMTIIDSEKHELNHKQCYLDQNINQLQRKYQKHSYDDRYGGAGTIISRAGSPKSVDERRAYYDINPVTGEKIYKYTDKTYTYIPTKVKTVDPKTGEEKSKTVKLTLYTDKKTGRQFTVDPEDHKKRLYRTEADIAKAKTEKRKQDSTKMAEVKDAYILTSGGSKEHPGHPMEALYADFANSMKDLGNRARLEYLNTGKLIYSPEAAKQYEPEVKSLNAKLRLALGNAPLERKAQALANKTMYRKKQDNPNMDAEHIKKYKGQALNAARKAVGAHKQRIDISDKEWEAIQAGAISDSKLKSILDNADTDILKQRAMPRDSRVLRPAQINKIKAMNQSGYSLTDIADALGVSVTTISNTLNPNTKKKGV